MAQTVLAADITALQPSKADCPAFSVPASFKIDEIDGVYKNGVHNGQLHAMVKAAAVKPSAPLGVLSNFNGTFTGHGFNTIFRPKNTGKGATTFPNPVVTGNLPDDNILELNLTKESLAFSQSLGDVPNRGFSSQADIFLNGVPYLQTIADLANPATGKADNKPTNIHFEPGLWMHVPATDVDPQSAASLSRMASIPHGTTINAQCLEPQTKDFVAGPPTISPVDMTPFVIGQPTNRIKGFTNQTASTTNSSRIPQDLTKFIAAGTITQPILDDPNTILRNAIKGQKITQTIFFTVSTASPTTDVSGGTANIAFLEGASGQPNADAAQMTATFWIETVQHTLEVPPWKPGQAPMLLAPSDTPSNATSPIFEVKPDHEITAKKTITVTSTQIQYSQLVLLNFGGLSWPHVSLATLNPAAPVPVPASALNY